MALNVKQFWQRVVDVRYSTKLNLEEFCRRYNENIEACDWEPHPLYSVFTQYDQECYLREKEAFLHKYKCFFAVSKTISPRRIIELGTCAGSSADAYLSAAPNINYIGLDEFGVNTRHDDHSPWDPYEVAVKLLKARGFKNYDLIRVDLRTLDKLPCKSDFVVVDAAHNFENQYADLKLALTAEPTFIFVDDADDENEVKPAINKFLKEDVKDKLDYTTKIAYRGEGLIIKLH